MFNVTNWRTYSAWATALIVTKMSDLFDAFTNGGVDNPVQSYYDPIIELIQNKRALDYLIGYNDFLADNVSAQYPLPLPNLLGDVEYLNSIGDSYVDQISLLSRSN